MQKLWRPVAALLLAAGAMAAGPAAAADAPAEIALTIQQNRFQPDEIRVKANTPFVLVITNKDATVEEFESRELRIEKVVPAGKTVRVRMPGLRPGGYPFVGEYHEGTAKGRIVAE
jgi:plastocyanin